MFGQDNGSMMSWLDGLTFGMLALGWLAIIGHGIGWWSLPQRKK